MKIVKCSEHPFFPTIRITKKCTQQCQHCCFACSPHETAMMTPLVANKVHQFLRSNQITMINIMGGEFWLNPDWEFLITLLSQEISVVRMVTNGDFMGNTKAKARVRTYFTHHPTLVLSISKDQYHTNRFVSQATQFCVENHIPYTLETQNLTQDTIVPVGRGQLYSGFYASLACYCYREPRCGECFMIDEIGGIYRCPFGIWDFDEIYSFLEGGFKARWEEFIRAFRLSHIMSCDQCNRVHNNVLSRQQKECQKEA